MESTIKEKKQPKGVLALGGFNFFILGLFSSGFFYSLYRSPTSSASQVLIAEFNKFLPNATLSTDQFKAIILGQIIIAVIFLFSGLGLLLKKDWGRRLTIYFSFLWLS